MSLDVVRPHAIVDVALISTVPWPGQDAGATVVAHLSHRRRDTSIHCSADGIESIVEWEEVADSGNLGGGQRIFANCILRPGGVVEQDERFGHASRWIL